MRPATAERLSWVTVVFIAPGDRLVCKRRGAGKTARLSEDTYDNRAYLNCTETLKHLGIVKLRA